MIAVIVIAVILIRAFTIEAFALSGAPVIAAEEITALLETALVGSGLYTESELEGKSYYELNDLLKDGISSNQINPKANYYTDPISGIQFDLFELLTKPEVQVGIGVTNGLVSSVADDVISDFISTITSVADFEKLSDFVEFTPSVDLKGSGALAVITKRTSTRRHLCYYYGDYGVIRNLPNLSAFDRLRLCSNENPACYAIEYSYDLNGTLLWDPYYIFGDRLLEYLDKSQGGGSGYEYIESIKYYGDWKTEIDDSPIETDDIEVPVIGEADGTQVTPDMLNPDGTVTIDGTTYYPKDFIDWDKFKDPAIVDLLNQILDAIKNTPVVSEQDKPIVDVDSIEIAVPDELSDYTVPAGISSVFPFCLPFDFSRGIKMLLAKPEVPVFKTEIDMTDFCGFDLGVVPLEISLEKWEPAVVVIRWFILLLFIFSLIFISTKIVKGAGA